MQVDSIQSGTLVSAKRSKNERSGVHAWHPYYAGYAESFVDSAIDFLNLDKSHLLLDPWNGSGTTALVSSRYGIQSLGFDVNPVMNIFSMAKSGFILANEPRVRSLANEISQLLAEQTEKNRSTDGDPLLDFMSPSLCKSVRTMFSLIESHSPRDARISGQLASTLLEECSAANPIRSFLKAALFVTARKAAGYSGGSNPTWVKTLEEKPSVSCRTLSKSFLNQVNLMLEDLKGAQVKKDSVISHVAMYGDARQLPIRDNSIDAIITSPPYLTRIDYAMSTRPELLLLANENELRKTREMTMGAPVIVDKSIVPTKVWGKICNSLLSAVREHPSKAARSYYFPNIVQYFRDAESSLRQIVRVLKPKSKALVVVQSSYFKEHEIELGEIFVEMCDQLNVKAKIVYRDVVKGHMAHVNSKSSQYKRDKVFYEDIVEITKS